MNENCIDEGKIKFVSPHEEMMPTTISRAVGPPPRMKRPSDDQKEFGHSIRVGISNVQLGCFSRQFNFVVAAVFLIVVAVVIVPNLVDGPFAFSP